MATTSGELEAYKEAVGSAAERLLGHVRLYRTRLDTVGAQLDRVLDALARDQSCLSVGATKPQ